MVLAMASGKSAKERLHLRRGLEVALAVDRQGDPGGVEMRVQPRAREHVHDPAAVGLGVQDTVGGEQVRCRPYAPIRRGECSTSVRPRWKCRCTSTYTSLTPKKETNRRKA